MQGGLGSIPTQGTRSHIPQRQSLQAATKTQVEPNKKINSCLKKKSVKGNFKVSSLGSCKWSQLEGKWKIALFYVKIISKEHLKK